MGKLEGEALEGKSSHMRARVQSLSPRGEVTPGETLRVSLDCTTQFNAIEIKLVGDSVANIPAKARYQLASAMASGSGQVAIPLGTRETHTFLSHTQDVDPPTSASGHVDADFTVPSVYDCKCDHHPKPLHLPPTIKLPVDDESMGAVFYTLHIRGRRDGKLTRDDRFV